VFVPVVLVALLSIAALSIDLGNLYLSYQQLEVSTQAAALAGAQMLPNNTQSVITPVVKKYGVASGDLNYHPNLSSPSMSVTYPSCLTTTGVPCYNGSGQSGTNAIVVTQSATVNTIIARIFGVKTLPVSAKAEASAAGGSAAPYDVMVVLDTTKSMNDTDSDSQCSTTRMQCALQNIQTLLSDLSPCVAPLTTCGTASAQQANSGGNVAQPVDEVGMMVFPGLCSDTGSGVTTGSCTTLAKGTSPTTTTANVTYAQLDYNCSGTNPPTASYNNNPEYLIVPLESNYRTSNTITTLNAGSNLVNAAGTGNCTITTGVQAPGGEGTFYAGAITSAQEYLAANGRANATNVIILISDGDASSPNVAGNVITNSNSALGPTGLYPAANACAQAVSAAQAAAGQGTLVYAIAYGAEASGCSNDTGAYKGNPCSTMENIASSPGVIPDATKFFSDYTATGSSGSCISSANPTTNLNQIFQKIAGQLTVARLVPNGTT
jgi:hypothetical protein